MPVVVEAAPGQEAVTAAIGAPPEEVGAEESPAAGRMGIVLSGDRRVIVDRAVDGPALSRAIAVLERR